MDDEIDDMVNISISLITSNATYYDMNVSVSENVLVAVFQSHGYHDYDGQCVPLKEKRSKAVVRSDVYNNIATMPHSTQHAIKSSYIVSLSGSKNLLFLLVNQWRLFL